MRCPSLLVLALVLLAPSAGHAKEVTDESAGEDSVVTAPLQAGQGDKTPVPGNTSQNTASVPTTGGIGSSDRDSTSGQGNAGTIATTQPTATPAPRYPSSQQAPDANGQAVAGNTAPQPRQADPKDLADTKEQAWSLLNGGNKDAAQAVIKEALKAHPEDKDLQALAALGERHQIVMDNAGLRNKMAALGSMNQTGALGQTVAQAQAPQRPILASALGFLGAAAQPQLVAAQAPAAMKGALSQSTFLKMQMKDYSGAENDLTNTIRQDPANWMAYRLRAFTRRFMHKIPEAENDANKALELNPLDGPSHDVKALLRLDSRDPESAVREASEALRLNGRDADALATRAQAYRALGQRESELADLKAAADINPEFGALYRQALYQNNAGGPGMSRVRALYAAAAGLALLFFGLSLIARKSGQTTKARPAMRAEDQTPSAGVTGYRILRRLGQGGMGVVYEAYDETLQRKVALKRMREEIAGDPRERKRFVREARVVAGLRHPGIVEIFTLVEQNEALYLVFEYLPGETLDELKERRGGKLGADEALRLVREIAEALDYAHSQGVVHQDLKPSNILVNVTGAKVMDFGIARRVQDTLSTMSRAEAVGTPAYMAPEQEMGVVTPKADLYALGVLTYELLAGRAPFGRGGGGFSKLDGKFTPLSEAAGLPPAVDPVIASALSADASQRPASASAFVAGLEAALRAQARA